MTNRMTPALATLAIGALVSLKRTIEGDVLVKAQYHEARVASQQDVATEFEFTDADTSEAHGFVTIWHDEGTSAGGVWSVDEVIHEPEAEDAPPVVEEPKAVAIVLPRGAGWLMDQARMLEAESAKYGEHNSYGSPKYAVQNALKSAASVLRSAVGNALAIEEGVTEIAS